MNRFLDGAAKAFQARRKAINYHGELFIEHLPSATEECLAVRFVPRKPSPAIILELVERNRLNVYLRSQMKANLGRVLLRLEDLRVVDNPTSMVEAFEWTISTTGAFEAPAPGDVASITARWEQLQLRSV